MQEINKIYEWLELAGNKFNDSSKINLAEKLIQEEIAELKQGVKENNTREILDAFADVIWVLCNLTYYKGISIKELIEIIKKVEISNYSKFCKNEQEAIDTVKAYSNGSHWDKQGVIIEAYYEKVNNYYIIKRKSDDKVLKSINYTPVENITLS